MVSSHWGWLAKTTGLEATWVSIAMSFVTLCAAWPIIAIRSCKIVLAELSGANRGGVVCFKQFYDQTFVGHLGDDMFHQLICLRAFAGS